MNSADLINMLRRRYAPPEYAFLEQVRSSLGNRGTIRTADAMAMSLWPGRGLELHGFEVKIDRRDWLREKKNPEQGNAIGQAVRSLQRLGFDGAVDHARRLGEQLAELGKRVGDAARDAATDYKTGAG